MARETAAQKLARQQREAAGEEPAAAPPKTPPLAPYTLFVQDAMHHPSAPEAGIVVWVPLPGEEKTPGQVSAASYQAAMDVALEQARARRAAVQLPEGEQAPAAVRLTVAAIASRNWNEGTALVELRPVTTWEKR